MNITDIVKFENPFNFPKIKKNKHSVTYYNVSKQQEAKNKKEFKIREYILDLNPLNRLDAKELVMIANDAVDTGIAELAIRRYLVYFISTRTADFSIRKIINFKPEYHDLNKERYLGYLERVVLRVLSLFQIEKLVKKSRKRNTHIYELATEEKKRREYATRLAKN